MGNIILETAYKYNDMGISCLPLKIEKGSEKIPIKTFSEFINRPQTKSDIDKYFKDLDCGIGILGGATSNNLLIADFDSHKGYQAAIDENKYFREICASTTLVKSKRGVHVYMRLPVPVHCGKVPEYKLDIKGQGGYTAAPPTVRFDGKKYEFIRSSSIFLVNSIEELSFLNLQEYTETIPKFVKGSPEAFPSGIFFGLPDKCRKILKDNKLCGYPSRSEAEASVVFTCIKNQWSFEQIIQLFKNYASEKTKYHERGYDQLVNLYNSALEAYSREMRSVDKTLLLLEQSLDTIVWPSNQSNYKSFVQSIIRIALECGKTEDVTISSRQLAERTGFTYQTSIKYINKLVEIGFLIVQFTEVSGLRHFRINTDYINPDVKDKGIFAYHSLIERECKGMAMFYHIPAKLDPSNDAFRHNALGKTGYQVLNYIHLKNGSSFTLKELFENVKASKITIKKKLKILIELFLIKRIQNTIYPMKSIGFKELKEIAIHLNSDGIGNSQRRQHNLERKNRKDYIEIMKNSANNLFIAGSK